MTDTPLQSQPKHERFCIRPSNRRVPVTVVVGLTFSVLLGGCLDAQPGAPVAQPIRLDGNQPCDRTMVVNCDEIEQDPQAPYVLRPVRLGPPPVTKEEVAGMHLVNLRRGAIIRDSFLEGFDIGIKVENATCSECSLVLERVTIHGGVPKINPSFRLGEGDTGPMVSDFLVAQGILIANSTPSVSLSDVSITMAGHGVVNELDSGISFWGGSIGINFGNTSASLSISNVTVESSSRSSRSGITFQGLNSTIDAKDVRVSGFTVGISGNHRQATFEGLALEDCRTGLYLYSRGDVTLSHFSVSRSRFGIEMYVPTYTEPNLRVEASATDGSVFGNEIRGLTMSEFVAVEVNNVSFVDNGRAYEAHQWPAESAGGLVLYDIAGVVRASEFVGNAPFGLATPGSGFVYRATSLDFIDARDNWWGSSTGPRFQAQDVLPTSPGEGDAVAEGVVFVPFRTNP